MVDRVELPAGLRRAEFAIHGLICGGGGALTVERALRAIVAVTKVYVNPLTETAYVEFDDAAVEIGDIVAAIEELGYRVTPGRSLARV